MVVQNGERIAVIAALHTDADAEARKVFLCFFTRIHAVLRFGFSFSFSSRTPYGTMVTRLSSSSSSISTDERFQPRSPRQSPAIRSFGSVKYTISTDVRSFFHSSRRTFGVRLIVPMLSANESMTAPSRLRKVRKPVCAVSR